MAAHAHVLLLAAVLFAVAPLAHAQTNIAPASPSADLPPGMTDVVFGRGGDRQLHALIETPAHGSGPFPAIIWIHGGGWHTGTYRVGMVGKIAQHGYFAASIEYRLDDEAKWPAQIEDCKCAVRWLRANAATYNIDPNRIGVWGGSAGGHLAACLGTMADVKEFEGDGGWPGVSSAVEAVVDYYGPTDFTDPDAGVYSQKAISLAQNLFGKPHDADPALWKSASPAACAKAGDPPVLIVHGEADSLVPVRQAQFFDAALAKAGVPHQLIIVKNAEHGLAALPGKNISPSEVELDRTVYGFFAKYLGPGK